MSSSEMSAKLEAQDNAWSSKFSEIDGQKSTMSNEMKECLDFSSHIFEICLPPEDSLWMKQTVVVSF